MASALCPRCGKHCHPSRGKALESLGAVRARRHGKARKARKRKFSAETHAYQCPLGWWHLSGH